MSDERSSDDRKVAARRGHHACMGCGGMYTTSEVDGAECGGLPGITYKVCGNCGHTRAKTKRQCKAN